MVTDERHAAGQDHPGTPRLRVLAASDPYRRARLIDQMQAGMRTLVLLGCVALVEWSIVTFLGSQS